MNGFVTKCIRHGSMSLCIKSNIFLIARNEINNIFNLLYLNDNCNQEDILSKYTSFVFKALMKTFFVNADIAMKIETPFSSCNLRR